MATQVICDRCRSKIDGLPNHVKDEKQAHPYDWCGPCYQTFGLFVRGALVVDKTTDTVVSFGPCPHGASGTSCATCHRPLCNLCGLYAAHGCYYCKEHAPSYASQAR